MKVFNPEWNDTSEQYETSGFLEKRTGASLSLLARENREYNNKTGRNDILTPLSQEYII